MVHHNNQASRCDWRSPQDYVSRARRVFNGDIGMDPSTSPDNPTGAKAFWCEKDNGLEQSWDNPDKSVWFNFPWTTDPDARLPPLKWWLAVLLDQIDQHGLSAIGLVASSPNSDWWHKYVWQADLIMWPKGRVAYDPPPGHAAASAPSFDTAVVYFGKNHYDFHREFGDLGRMPGYRP